MFLTEPTLYGVNLPQRELSTQPQFPFPFYGANLPLPQPPYQQLPYQQPPYQQLPYQTIPFQRFIPPIPQQLPPQLPLYGFQPYAPQLPFNQLPFNQLPFNQLPVPPQIPAYPQMMAPFVPPMHTPFVPPYAQQRPFWF